MGINEELKDIKILQDMLNKLNNPQGFEDYNKIIEDIEKILLSIDVVLPVFPLVSCFAINFISFSVIPLC